jgi:hypothetical protein
MRSFNIKLKAFSAMTVLVVLTACSKEWLEPEPLSFFAPENTFVDKAGFDALLLSSRKQLRHEYFGDNSAICTEYFLSDLAVNGNPEASRPHDLQRQILPTGTGEARIMSGNGSYWALAWDGIKYANITISRVDDIEWPTEDEKNSILAEGYFHRAYWYYRLVHQFGDVPLILREVTEPKLDFYSSTRESILKQIRTDMEFAVKWLPQDILPGQVNRAAGNHLLTKIYLSLREFDKAIASASWVVESSGHHLMKERFGAYANDPKYNIMWDLHQKENKSTGNSEALLVVQDKFMIEGEHNGGTQLMRNAIPAWWWTPVRDPSGARGVTDHATLGQPLLDSLGRGIGRVRTANYFNYQIWDDENDLRHSDVNWWSMDEYYYNNPNSDYYRQPFVREALNDTVRTWYPFQYNKLYVADEERTGSKDIRGGHSDWYVFRLAGTYLLRAEAYYWKGDLQNAANDVNEVRRRAGASEIQSSDIDIESIFAERARELYFESPRKTELTRVAYIMAQLGKKGYSIENMSENNWFYDMVIKHNIFYRDEVSYGANPYRIRPYHVYWPIPQSSISANTQGHINQNEGYPGSEFNTPPLESN